jgi:hypothetical protein
MIADSAYKNLGFLAVLILFLGLAFLVYKWPQNKGLTFSQHAAAQRVSIGYYVGLFAVVLPLLNLFFIEWFVPVLRLSEWFIICVAVSSVAQFACTLIPETAGLRAKRHRALAGLSALLLVPPVGLLLFSDHIHAWLKIVISLCLIVMVSVIGAISLLKDKVFGWRAQALYFSAFFVAILSVTYLAQI